TNQAALVGRLSVPQGWTAAAQVANPAGATFAGGGWTNAVGPGAGAVGAGRRGGRWLRPRPALRVPRDRDAAATGRGVTGGRTLPRGREPAGGARRKVNCCKRLAVGLTDLLPRCHDGLCKHLAR